MDRLHLPNSLSLDDLPEHVENLNKDNLEFIIKCIEISVSHGWLGVAAELSEILANNNMLKRNVELFIRVEIEKLKRYHYFGLNKQATLVSNKLIKHLNNVKDRIESKSNWLLWKYTAVGHVGWIENDLSKLSSIIIECQSITHQCKSNPLKIVYSAFNTALDGRLKLLKGDTKGGCYLFEKSINALQKHQTNKFNALRMTAHIKLNYAECLHQIGKKEEACHIARAFLSEAYKYEFKTHLLIKAMVLMLGSEEYLYDEEHANYALRYQIIIFAMGLTQFHNLYPLLKKGMDYIPGKDVIDMYQFDLEAWMKKSIEKLDWEGFEKLIINYHNALGDKVFELPKDFPAFDLIVKEKSNQPDMLYTKAIQVKYWKSGKVNEMPRIKTFKAAEKRLKKEHPQINAVTWYVYSDITEEAEDELKVSIESLFGEHCLVSTVVGVQQIINFYIRKPQLFAEIILQN